MHAELARNFVEKGLNSEAGYALRAQVPFVQDAIGACFRDSVPCQRGASFPEGAREREKGGYGWGGRGGRVWRHECHACWAFKESLGHMKAFTTAEPCV